jgi:hypothetical protein
VNDAGKVYGAGITEPSAFLDQLIGNSIGVLLRIVEFRSPPIRKIVTASLYKIGRKQPNSVNLRSVYMFSSYRSE